MLARDRLAERVSQRIRHQSNRNFFIRHPYESYYPRALRDHKTASPVAPPPRMHPSGPKPPTQELSSTKRTQREQLTLNISDRPQTQLYTRSFLRTSQSLRKRLVLSTERWKESRELLGRQQPTPNRELSSRPLVPQSEQQQLGLIGVSQMNLLKCRPSLNQREETVLADTMLRLKERRVADYRELYGFREAVQQRKGTIEQKLTQIQSNLPDEVQYQLEVVTQLRTRLNVYQELSLLLQKIFELGCRRQVYTPAKPQQRLKRKPRSEMVLQKSKAYFKLSKFGSLCRPKKEVNQLEQKRRKVRDARLKRKAKPPQKEPEICVEPAKQEQVQGLKEEQELQIDHFEEDKEKEEEQEADSQSSGEQEGSPQPEPPAPKTEEEEVVPERRDQQQEKKKTLMMQLNKKLKLSQLEKALFEIDDSDTRSRPKSRLNTFLEEKESQSGGESCSSKRSSEQMQSRSSLKSEKKASVCSNTSVKSRNRSKNNIRPKEVEGFVLKLEHSKSGRRDSRKDRGLQKFQFNGRRRLDVISESLEMLDGKVLRDQIRQLIRGQKLTPEMLRECIGNEMSRILGMPEFKFKRMGIMEIVALIEPILPPADRPEFTRVVRAYQDQQLTKQRPRPRPPEERSRLYPELQNIYEYQIKMERKNTYRGFLHLIHNPDFELPNLQAREQEPGSTRWDKETEESIRRQRAQYFELETEWLGLLHRFWREMSHRELAIGQQGERPREQESVGQLQQSLEGLRAQVQRLAPESWFA